MNLPPPIQRYFEAERTGDAKLILDAFAAGASVKDEGKTHLGHLEIASWWHAAKEEYQHSARPIQVEEDGGITLVRAQVTGRFPGSPAVLGFAFQLNGDRITRLEIGA